MKRQPPPAAPLKFTRADPAELARFDDRKVCVMNCGKTSSDPRSDKELRFLCDDCLTKAVEKYATICAGVAREECRGDKANPDYKAREAARNGYIKAIKDAEERIRATLVVDGESPTKLREAIAQRVADLGKPTAT